MKKEDEKVKSRKLEKIIKKSSFRIVIILKL